MNKLIRTSLVAAALAGFTTVALAEDGEYYSGTDAYGVSMSSVAKRQFDKFSTGSVNRTATPRATTRDNRETGDDGYYANAPRLF
jgi:hypothetical protein